MKLSEITEGINGVLVCDGEFEKMNYCTSHETRVFLSFIEKEKFVEKINEKVTCIFCSRELKDRLPEHIKGVFVTEEPKYVFHKCYNLFMESYYEQQEFETTIGDECNISPMAYIAKKNVIIEDGVTIEPFVVINEGTTIKRNCQIHSNVVVGGKAFSTARSKTGEMCALKCSGQVVLEENVEIYSQTHIAQGIWSDDITRIGKNSQIQLPVY